LKRNLTTLLDSHIRIVCISVDDSKFPVTLMPSSQSRRDCNCMAAAHRIRIPARQRSSTEYHTWLAPSEQYRVHYQGPVTSKFVT